MIIIHTNDMHNHPGSKLEALVEKYRSNQEIILLDAGDAVSATNITCTTHEPILQKMSEMRYDAMTLGNREFHFSASGMRTTLQDAKFPVLCANLDITRGDLEYITPYIILDRWGMNIGIFGLTVPMITDKMKVKHLSVFRFHNPLKIAMEVVKTLRLNHKVDLVIALTHIGYSQDKELAASVEGIDLIIGGHSHTVLPEGEWVNDTFITQTGSHGKYIGEVHFAPDSSPKFRTQLVDSK